MLGSPGASPGVFVLMPGPMRPTGCLRLGGYTDGRSKCYRYVDRVQQRRHPEGTTAARCQAMLAGSVVSELNLMLLMHIITTGLHK